ncbi:ABC transporter substrate-binding protein [Colwellia sp. 1_MG-2023]|uniref:ABC transporter substrate-binding protein n=1 Tax=Colwellia sp. 1_MG-2023 TaxID=3062649 RepID=UPI0026E35E1A|nr:ABC transporter substrate-binding protein [Colwellia sp. 1_MG-2023]MDO6444754.1 ABC transporter substrate-binding protein [Colwellia sp. 1_MG-2023]
MLYKNFILLRLTLCAFICVSSNAVGNLNNQQVIKLAVSNATSGPTSQLGIRLNQGANAYFSRVNLEGGVAGKTIKIEHLDDGYEPFKTLKNTQKFLARNDIFAFFNYVGTPTTHAILNLISDSETPFLMPFTGAEFLRTPAIGNIFHLRASYYQETEQQINYLVDSKKITNIGLLIQADEFGTAVEKGYLMALKDRGLKPTVTTRYRRNTNEIDLALSILKAKNVQAVAFVGTYEPFAQLINSAYQQNFTPFFTSVSFISSHDLFQRLNQASNVLVTEVMPDPNACYDDICLQFKQDMRAQGIEEVDQILFEGYLNAFVFVEVAKLCGIALSQSCFLENMANFEYNQKGLSISFKDNAHQGLSSIFLNFFTSTINSQ